MHTIQFHSQTTSYTKDTSFCKLQLSFYKAAPIYSQRNRSNQVGNICICQEKMRILQLKTDNGRSSALQQHYQQKEISLGNGTDRISS